MKEIVGKYSTAKVFASVIEDEALTQIKSLCDQPFMKNVKVRVMPDVHAGKGCTIGTTMTVTDKVCPNLVGVDIGCAVLVTKIKGDIDLEKFDKAVNLIPAGQCVNQTIQGNLRIADLDLKCKEHLHNWDRLDLSISSLGGGNHFISIEQNNQGENYLLIHTGSRNLGKQVADYYQAKAVEQVRERESIARNLQIAYTKKHKPMNLWESLIQEIKIDIVPDSFCYLTDTLKNNYLNDMFLCQEWAKENRRMICENILKNYDLGLEVVEQFETVHNYIDPNDMILRKGAVQANKGQKLVIPLNMRDGSLIAIGKGNSDWNNSAPHGAGRLMSRTQAKKELSMDSFKESMKDIYSTSVCEETLDEAPSAYKPIEAILDIVGDTVEIIEHVKPIYNFKSKN